MCGHKKLYSFFCYDFCACSILKWLITFFFSRCDSVQSLKKLFLSHQISSFSRLQTSVNSHQFKIQKQKLYVTGYGFLNPYKYKYQKTRIHKSKHQNNNNQFSFVTIATTRFIRLTITSNIQQLSHINFYF